MLGKLFGFVSGSGPLGWIVGGLGAAAILGVLGTAAWYIDDYGYQKRMRAAAETENVRLEGELGEAVSANDSLKQARIHDAYRHQRELGSVARIAEQERQDQQDLLDLAGKLAAIPADQDCVGGPALQDLIDTLRGEAGP